MSSSRYLPALAALTIAVSGAIVLAPTAGADVTCRTKYYGSAWHTSCSDGSTVVCYPGGSCHYKERGRNPYAQLEEARRLLEEAGQLP